MKTLKIAFVIFIWFGIGSASIIHDFNFSLKDYSFSKEGEYDFITYSDCYYTREVGSPCLPVIVANIVIPLDRKISDFSIDLFEYQELEGSYYIFPSQPFYPYDFQTEWTFVPPYKEVYESTEPYPDELVKISGFEYSGGAKIARVAIYPFQYVPKDKRLLLYNHIKVTFNLSPSEDKSFPVIRRTQEQHNRYIEKVKSMVINPEDVEPFMNQPLIVPPQDFGDMGPWTFVIITSQNVDSQFHPLAEWRIKQGMNTKIVWVEWIESNYYGDDAQERIKSFVQDAYANLGTEYILMGGDSNYVPCRIVEPHIPNPWYYNCIFPTDLYYTGIDGDWDFDEDGIYGEWDDDASAVDLSPDLWIGRAKVSTTDEASIFLDKILTYEKNPPPYEGERDLILMGAACFKIRHPNGQFDLWGGGDAKEYLVQRTSIPPTKYRMYDQYYGHYQGGEQMNQEIRKDRVITHLNLGYYLVNHVGHGGYTKLSVSPNFENMYVDIIYSHDLDSLLNETKYGVMYSVGCKTAAFEKGLDSCFAQHYLVNPNRGGVAYIGPSHTGFGAIPIWTGPANKLDNYFIWSRCGCEGDEVPPGLRFKYPKIGEAWGNAVTIYNWSADGYYGYWQEMVTNLLGDPTMHLWIKEPLPLTVTHPDTILPDVTVDFTIYVTSNGTSVESSLVCLYMPNGIDEIYKKAFTDASGEATFTITPTSEGDLFVTVTKPDYLPYEGVSKVELIPPKLWGMFMVNGEVLAKLSWSWDPGAYYLDHYELFRVPDIIYSGTNTSYTDPLPFAPGEMRRYHVDAWYRKTPGGDLYVITSNTVILQRRGLFLYSYNDSELAEDNNILSGSVDGESVFDFYKLRHPPVEENGLYRLELREFESEHSFVDMVKLIAIDHPGEISIEALGEDIILSYMSAFTPLYCVDQTGEDWTDLVGNPEDGCFEGYEGDTLIMNFGEIEGGNYVFLPIASPKSGSMDVATYDPETDWQTIQTIYPREHSSISPVVINHSFNDSLKIRLIWHGHYRLEYAGLGRIRNASYHIKPCPLVSANHSEIGSIKQKLLIDDDNYAELLPGDMITLEFVATGQTPGWIRDFVFVSNGYYIMEGDGGTQTATSNIPLIHSLSLYPNPAKNNMTIRFGIPKEERVSLKVYDVSGREVKTLEDGRLKAGYYTIRLDNMNLPSGIYFARLETDSYKETKKLVLIK